MYAKFTTVLKDLLENEETRPLIDKALSTYPLYKSKSGEIDMIPTREELNSKLLNHYKYREIFSETVGRFIDELEIVMNEIMPHYNELFKTVEIMANLENPFDNVDFIESYKETRVDSSENEGSVSTTSTSDSESETTLTTESNSTSSGESDSSSTHKRKFSDTPQNNISNIDSYLTDYTDESDTAQGTSSQSVTSNGSDISSSNGSDTSTGTSQTTGSASSTGTTEHTFTKKGNQGVNTYAHDMNEFRTSIIDVVNQIINDKRVAELFMLVY